VLLPILDDQFKQQVEAIKHLIQSEVNVKDIEYITDTGGLLKKKIKPNFKTLGRRLGKHMKAANGIISALDQNAITQIESEGTYMLTIEDQSYDLALDDFEISSEDIPGWQVATDGKLTVALDISLDDDLIAEGTARELVNRIQNLRKTKDFNVTDRILVKMEHHPAILPAIQQFGNYIKNEVLANAIELLSQVDGEKVELYENVVIRMTLEVDN
jgi:isoleucyl-tRNA synthetase